MIQNRTRFVLALAALMVVGFLATSLSSYFVARDSLSNSISEQMLPLTSDNIYSEIQRDLLRPILISSVMATDTFLRDWVLQGEEDIERIRTYLEEIQDEYDTITAFYVSEETRRYYHPDGVLRQVSEDESIDDWYFRVRNMDEPYEVNVDTDTADRSRVSIFINYRVLDYAGEYIGATGVGLSVQAVTELIDTYQQRYNRTIYFTDRQGNITLTGADQPEAERLREKPGLASLRTRILSNPSSSLTYEDPDGERVYLNSRLVPEFDWYLIVEQHSSDAEQRIDNTLLVNLAMSSVIMLAVLLIAHFTLRAYQRRLEQMATTDRLTGAANRHMFEMLFEHILRGLERRRRPVSIISIDIDHFKEVNDDYGHQAGDAALQAVTDIIRQHTREADTLCRWGGEEFLLLMDDCPLEEARERAEEIRGAAMEQTITFGREQIRLTLSIAVTQHRGQEKLDALLSRVDAALYRAKSEGRNRVCVAS